MLGFVLIIYVLKKLDGRCFLPSCFLLIRSNSFVLPELYTMDIWWSNVDYVILECSCFRGISWSFSINLSFLPINITFLSVFSLLFSYLVSFYFFICVYSLFLVTFHALFVIFIEYFFSSHTSKLDRIAIKKKSN